MFLVLTVTTLLGSILAVEARAWLPHVGRRLVSQAMKRLPKELSTDLRERWTSEIEADLASFHDRPLSGFVFALRVRLKGGRDLAAELALQQAIALEHPAPVVEKKVQEGSLLTTVTLLKWSLDNSQNTMLKLLEISLKEVVSGSPDRRRARLEEIEKALGHPLARQVLDRIDPDPSTEEGLKMTLVLQDLRKEVEGWNDRG